MNRTALAVLGAGATAVAVWLWLRSRTPAGEVSITEIGDDPAGFIDFTPPDIQVDMPTLAAVDVEYTTLESIAVGARKVASTISSWFHPSGEQYRPLFDAAEAKYGIPHGLLFRQAFQESRFRTDIITGVVRSAAGAVGIMQIIPRWHPSLDPGDAAADERAALDPARAIPYAAKYLSQLRKQFGSWPLALAAYNWGPGNVSKNPPDKWPTETRNYVADITADIDVRNA